MYALVTSPESLNQFVHICECGQFGRWFAIKHKNQTKLYSHYGQFCVCAVYALTIN